MIGRVAGFVIAALIFKHPVMILLGFAVGWWFDKQQKNAAGSSEEPFNYSSNTSAQAPLAQAFQLLGVAETASEKDIKKAYKKRISQHHPDKVVARGGSEQEVRQATEKVQEIQAAYQLIMQTVFNL